MPTRIDILEGSLGLGMRRERVEWKAKTHAGVALAKWDEGWPPVSILLKVVVSTSGFFQTFQLSWMTSDIFNSPPFGLISSKRIEKARDHTINQSAITFTKQPPQHISEPTGPRKPTPLHQRDKYNTYIKSIWRNATEPWVISLL